MKEIYALLGFFWCSGCWFFECLTSSVAKRGAPSKKACQGQTLSKEDRIDTAREIIALLPHLACHSPKDHVICFTP